GAPAHRHLRPRHRPDAGRAAGGPRRAGSGGPALRMAAGDGAQGGSRGLAHRRGPRLLPAAGGPVQGHGNAAGNDPGRARHGRPSQMKRPETALLVFAKEPVAGQAKTRLSPPLTPAVAARLAAAMLEDTLAAVAALGAAGMARP